MEGKLERGRGSRNSFRTDQTDSSRVRPLAEVELPHLGIFRLVYG